MYRFTPGMRNIQAEVCRTCVFEVGMLCISVNVPSLCAYPRVFLWAPYMAPNLDPNTDTVHTIYKIGAIEHTPPDQQGPITRAHRNSLEHSYTYTYIYIHIYTCIYIYIYIQMLFFCLAGGTLRKQCCNSAVLQLFSDVYSRVSFTNGVSQFSCF